MIAPSSEIWGKLFIQSIAYRTTGGSGEVVDWNKQVWATESQSPVGQKKETILSFFYDCMF